MIAALRLITIKVESWSQIPSPRLGPRASLSMHTIDDVLPHVPFTMQLHVLGMWYTVS